MNSPKVSIVMPAYNASRTIGYAIDSVLAQSFSNFELIICNDSSTDATGDILLSINDPRIHVVNNSSNLGEGLSRDQAIQQATGQWLAFIDADDAWEPSRLQKLMTTVEILGECFVFDDIFECHDTLNGMIHWRTLRGNSAFGGNGCNTVNVPIEHLIFSHRSLLKPIFPLHYIREHNITHSTRKYAADFEFFLRVLALGKLSIWYFPEPLYFYRLTPNSVSNNKLRFKLFKEVLVEGKKLFPESLSIHNSIEKKISLLDRDEEYITFVWAIKSRQFGKAFYLAWLKPCFIFKEFLNRIVSTLAYHTHRILYGGRRRYHPPL